MDSARQDKLPPGPPHRKQGDLDDTAQWNTPASRFSRETGTRHGKVDTGAGGAPGFAAVPSTAVIAHQDNREKPHPSRPEFHTRPFAHAYEYPRSPSAPLPQHRLPRQNL